MVATGGPGISGRVVDEAGLPAAGVVVRACANADCTIALTAADGRYVVALGSPGAYTMDFWDPSERLATMYLGREGTLRAGLTRLDAALQVEVGHAVVALDEVHLLRGLTISGTVTAPDGARVAAVSVSAESADGAYYPFASSGSDGRYRLAGLVDGTYRIYVASQGRYGDGYYRQGGFTNWEEPTPVAAGGRLDLRLVRGYRIAGTITDASGAAAEGILVGLFNLGASDTTDASGRYEMRGLLPGAYDVEVQGSARNPISVQIMNADVLDLDVRLPAPTPTPGPSPTPFAYRPASPAGLRINGFAGVVADDLVVRSAPFVGAGSQILEPPLAAGDRLLILEGPVEASGYRWYRVEPRSAGDGQHAPSGWVAAAGRDGEIWIEALPCPTLPIDIGTLVSMTGAQRLSCFGGDTLTFDAYARGIGVADGWIWSEPGWLSPARNFAYIGDRTGPCMQVVFAPGSGVPPTEGEPWGTGGTMDRYRITGHFDDPASTECRSGYEDEAGVRHDDPVEEARLACRTQFVITDRELLSAD